MRRAFKDAYERELLLLKERAAQFGAEYPGLADRLGGLLEENLDPSIAGLLEGTAFMAARVQLNLDQQFRVFSEELLEHLSPDMCAPLPSAMMVQGVPAAKPEELRGGPTIDKGSYIEATFSNQTRRIPIRYQTTEPITFWPLQIAGADYHSTATPLNALGCDTPAMTGRGETLRTAAGLVIRLTRTDRAALDGLACDVLPIHFCGTQTEAMALYAQVFANLSRVSLRWEDKMGTPVFRRLPIHAIEQVGFDADCPLYRADERQFPGVSTLLEYFSFPRKFLGFRIRGLADHLRGIPEKTVQLVMEFDAPNTHLASHFNPDNLRLFCAPAVNLFEDEAKPITLDNRHHRFLVAPNRAPETHFEVHKITSVRAQYEGVRDKVTARPLYGLPPAGATPRDALYYSARRERRGLTPEERRAGGTRFRYEGTQTWLTFYEPPDHEPAHLLLVSTLCSSRHLPEIVPISETPFHLLDDRMIQMRPVTAATPPREAVAELEGDGPHRARAGDNYWRLISLLSLSYRGFIRADGQGNVEALREVIRLFSDVSDQLTETQIEAITDVRARPRVRTIKRPDGYHPARGLEITLQFDENVLDPAAMIAMGAALDRFLADYAAINSFTECVIANGKGKEIKRWPPRGGSGPLL
ncbi:type VI secretion system baseplate subunit TssF [Sulfitobacter albidus]|uniref:Type VI secretion system baseplate subunit TssF n=1 Tax=Sulfitobacter albidus TaxID=2829501 RepID=A0A975JGX1_9RHOB|nr:type VI secretion system baseplate subunit TssF [Sulfitobacter albidus]QUJ78248.1 type VI secretion system baseplate subunit TssF [Sulfitobacter albidus]